MAKGKRKKIKRTAKKKMKAVQKTPQKILFDRIYIDYINSRTPTIVGNLWWGNFLRKCFHISYWITLFMIAICLRYCYEIFFTETNHDSELIQFGSIFLFLHLFIFIFLTLALKTGSQKAPTGVSENVLSNWYIIEGRKYIIFKLLSIFSFLSLFIFFNIKFGNEFEYITIGLIFFMLYLIFSILAGTFPKLILSKSFSNIGSLFVSLMILFSMLAVFNPSSLLLRVMVLLLFLVIEFSILVLTKSNGLNIVEMVALKIINIREVFNYLLEEEKNQLNKWNMIKTLVKDNNNHYNQNLLKELLKEEKSIGHYLRNSLYIVLTFIFVSLNEKLFEDIVYTPYIKPILCSLNSTYC